MNPAKKVINRLKKKNRTYSIQILGNEKNKDNAFKILMGSTLFNATAKETYHGIPQIIIDLLNEAEIDFKIL